MDKTFKEILTRNLVWAITTLVALGVWLATIMYQGKAIDAQGSMIQGDHERIGRCELTDIKLASVDDKIGIKLESIDNGIKDLRLAIERIQAENKAEFNEIKKILYKPVIGNAVDQTGSNAILSSK